MSYQKVAVVIPVYRAELTATEQISLHQCLRVLAKYPIIVVKPESLVLSGWAVFGGEFSEVSLPNHYFASIAGYNSMMLSAEFYQQFTDYQYILIHQLDAFVFNDQLTDWCNKGFDYIGAPWLKDLDFKNKREEYWFNFKKWIAIRFNLKKPDGVSPLEIQLINSVGNGGFSLRNVAKFIKVLQVFETTIKLYESHKKAQFNEDVFWGIEVNRTKNRMNIPDWRTALHFAVEFFPEKAYRFNENQLPFGCHAWDIHGTDFWRPFFKEQGYEI